MSTSPTVRHSRCRLVKLLQNQQDTGHRSGARKRSLDFKFQLAWTLEVSRSNSPTLVCWRFKSDCTAFHDSPEVAIAIVALEANRCRNILIRSVEDERH